MILFTAALPCARQQSHAEHGRLEQSNHSCTAEALGGEAAVDAAVDIFYRKVLSDERIRHFFAGVAMEQLAAKQKVFLTMAFGGPHRYSGLDLHHAHAHLVARGLDDAHFDAVLENLGATLRELAVPDDLIAEAAGIAESTRAAVLGR